MRSEKGHSRWDTLHPPENHLKHDDVPDLKRAADIITKLLGIIKYAVAIQFLHFTHFPFNTGIQEL